MWVLSDHGLEEVDTIGREGGREEGREGGREGGMERVVFTHPPPSLLSK